MFSRVSSVLSSTVRSLAVPSRMVRTAAATATVSPSPGTSMELPEGMPDRLFSSIELEYRGHDKAVLKSYTSFLEQVCEHLNVSRGKTEVLPYVSWVQPALRSKFVHKKYKLHYETRTHITRFEVVNLTGSTASAFLEYIQRNIPEGVGMRVGYVERQLLPATLQLK